MVALDYSDWVESADLRGSRRRITKCGPCAKKPPAPGHCKQLSPRPNIPRRTPDIALPKSRCVPFAPHSMRSVRAWFHAGREHYQRGKPRGTGGHWVSPSAVPTPEGAKVSYTMVSHGALHTREPAACRLPEQELLRNLACRARDAPCRARPSIRRTRSWQAIHWASQKELTAFCGTVM